jgi:DNA-binding HxlR family transcriptional regulator
MRVDCQCRAFQQAIALLGKPWTALILSVLQERSMRFNELAAEAHGPAAKVLSARLKELESRGLIHRNVEPGPPIRVSYQLTAKGRAFEGVTEAIERFGRSLA